MLQPTKKWSEAHLRRTYDTSTDYLLVIAPTVRELGGLRPNRLAGYEIAEIGLGRSAAINLREILQTRRPQILLSIGFGGALNETLRTGDVVVNVEAMIQMPRRCITMNSKLTHHAVRALRAAGVPVSKGRTLTVSEPLMSSEAKQRHGALTGASVVEMETFWIAQEADRSELPLISVRSVIDEMHHNLPELVAHITADGGQREWYHTLRAIRNPTTISSLIRLATRSRKAAVALRTVVEALVPVLAKNAPIRAVHR